MLPKHHECRARRIRRASSALYVHKNRLDEPWEKTVPQGQDPPGAENGEQQSPPSENKEVIPPPPVGDEDIYTQVPNPEAGHEEEVIPPPAPDEAPSVTPPLQLQAEPYTLP